MKKITVLLAAAALAVAAPAMATPYASGIQDLGSGNYSFVLNEDADSVVVNLAGGGTLDLGAQTKGTVSFSGAYESIAVSKTAAAGWTQISNDADNTSKYYSPKGLTVDTRPMAVGGVANPNFGRIYVNNAYAGTTTMHAVNRTTTDGIYVMTADQADVLGQGDTPYTGGVDWTTSGSSAFKLGLNRNDPYAQDNNLYMGDWSDGHAGIWAADITNMSGSFTPVLTNVDRQSSGLVQVNGEDIHGSVAVGPWVEGVGADRKMFTLDEDVRRGNVLQYDLGTSTGNYDVAPTDRTQEQTENGSGGYILQGLNDLVRAEDGTWWLAQYRSTDSTGCPSLSHWADDPTDPASEPIWTSGDSLQLDAAYGSIDILGDKLVMGTLRGFGLYVIDISDPDNPVLEATIAHNGNTIRDVSFDAAGNIYVVSSSSETLRIYSPGGFTSAVTGADGSFTVVPEPATLALLALGGFALLRRR